MNCRRMWASALAQACALVAFLVCGVPSASAVVVHTPNGHFLGILPHQGVAPGSIPGSVAAQRRANFSSNGNLNYHGGPVVHSSAAYLVFWTPSGFSVPTSSQSLLKRYFSDAATDNGKPSNAFAVARQFTDGSGFADYKQTFNASTQTIADTQTYPAFDPNNCNLRGGEAKCISDAQIEAELQRLISTGLPDDGASSTSLPSSAPIYFVVLPSNVNVCDRLGSCADNIFCSYHSSFTTGSTHHNVLYATIPFLAAAQFAKPCQFDGNAVVQQPNGDPLTDVALKFLSHEHNEVLTDPLGSGWYDNSSGNENGDNCNRTGSANPSGGTSPTAFQPTLGGSPAAGSLYDQLMAGNQYYLQSEWSNGDVGCQMAPSAGSITPQFTTPGGSITEGTSASFNPSASSSTNPLSSASWDFGDGTTTFKTSSPLAVVSHTYTAAGQFTVKLTLVDNRGNLATLAHQVTVVDETPSAAFTIGVPQPTVGQSVPFDASASSDPDGSIASYVWNFGDGPSTAVTTPTTNHAYAAPGTYTVTLKVIDSIGQSSTITSQQVTVIDGPIASFTFSPPSPLEGTQVSFDGSSSHDPEPGATIVSYTWIFGDGTSGSGLKPTHTYSKYGTYTVKLTVTNSNGVTDTAPQTITVTDEVPTAAFVVTTSLPATGQPVRFNGASSGDVDGTISSYSWNFGDGSTGSGATPSHVYSNYGTYTVTLTVTDSDGRTANVSQQLTVHATPIAAFSYSPSRPPLATPVSFDAGGSIDPEPGVTITSYSWDFGDGGTGSGLTLTHTYAAYGTYTVTLTITNSVGLSSSTSQRVGVHASPIASFTFSPRQPLLGAVVAFDGTGSSDPEPGATIASYSWDFGDGSTATGSTPPHTYQRPGTYTITLNVSTNFGTTSSTTQSVTVSDELPNAVIVLGTASPVSGQPVQFDGSHSTDAADPIVSYAWSFGDGTTGSGARLAHTYRKAGSYRAQLTVTDGFGGSATAVDVIRVGLPGRITGLALRSGPRGATLVIAVSSGGVLSAGRRSIRLPHGGFARVRIKLSRTQVKRVGGGGSVTIHIALSFSPLLGPPSRERLTVVFHRPPSHGRRVYARLKR